MTSDVPAAVFSLKGEPTAAVLLAGGATLRAAAAQAGVAEKTLARRLATAEYSSYVARLRSRLVDEAVGQLATAATEAVATLREVAKTGPPSARVRAASSLLAHVVALSEAHETRLRLDLLEARIVGSQQHDSQSE